MPATPPHEHPPFAQPSHEPRFALEFPSVSPAAIALGLEAIGLMTPAALAPPLFRGYADEEGQDWLAVALGNSYHPYPLKEPADFEDFSSEQTTEHIVRWLTETAAYPEQPWFDGGEGRGFQMWQVAWEQEPRRFYGYTLIRPKWFEIHK